MDFIFFPRPQSGTTGVPPDGQYAYAKTPDKQVSIYKLQAPLSFRIMSEELERLTVLELAFRATVSGTTHAALRTADLIFFFDLSAERLVGGLSLAPFPQITCMAFGASGDSLFLGSEEGTLFRVACEQFDANEFPVSQWTALVSGGIAKISMNGLLSSNTLLLSEEGELFLFSAEEGLIHYEPLEGARFHPLDFIVSPFGEILLLKDRLVVSKNGLLTYVSIEGSEQLAIRGIGASTQYDALVFGRRHIFGVTIDLSNFNAIRPGSEIVEKPDVLVSQLAYCDKEILHLVETPQGRLLALYE